MVGRIGVVMVAMFGWWLKGQDMYKFPDGIENPNRLPWSGYIDFAARTRNDSDELGCALLRYVLVRMV